MHDMPTAPPPPPPYHIPARPIRMRIYRTILEIYVHILNQMRAWKLVILLNHILWSLKISQILHHLVQILNNFEK